MKALDSSTLERIAEAVCGAHGTEAVNWAPGPYRSQYDIEQFLTACGIRERVQGGSRKYLVLNTLMAISYGVEGDPFIAIDPDLVGRVLLKLVDFRQFTEPPQAHEMAQHLNKFLLHEHLQLRFDATAGSYALVELAQEEYVKAIQAAVPHAAPRPPSAPQRPESRGPGRVFVVHGHDEQAKAETEALVGRLGLESVVLHRQANEGKTLIEKIEAHSDVGYVLVLVTPDDFGRSVRDGDIRARARQNVVFEMGYFFGKLGRRNVMCLCRKDVELPSDIHGLVYETFERSVDELEPKIRLELQAAGILP